MRDPRAELWMMIKRGQRLKKYRNETQQFVTEDCVHDILDRFCNGSNWWVEKNKIKFEDFARNIVNVMDEFHLKANLPNRMASISYIKHRAMGMHNLAYELDEWRSNLSNEIAEKLKQNCSQLCSVWNYK